MHRATEVTAELQRRLNAIPAFTGRVFVGRAAGRALADVQPPMVAVAATGEVLDFSQSTRATVKRNYQIECHLADTDTALDADLDTAAFAVRTVLADSSAVRWGGLISALTYGAVEFQYPADGSRTAIAVLPITVTYPETYTPPAAALEH